jgi:hypothetical protein
VFGAVAKADTDITTLIRQSLRSVGRTDDTEVTAFTDGCPGLRSILVDAGITVSRGHPCSIGSTSQCGSSTGRPAELGGLQSIGLHKLKGALRNFWSIDINDRWRLLFRFKDGDAFDVHIFDPH